MKKIDFLKEKNMNITVLIGSIFGQKIKTIGTEIFSDLHKKYPEHDISLLDLSAHDIQFSDGRNYMDYTGDTSTVIQQLLQADVIFIVTPIFQASIPGALKNVFDLLPLQALEGKTVGIVSVAGSEKHFLVVEQHLKPVLSFLKANIIQSYVFILSTEVIGKTFTNPHVIERLEKLVEETIQSGVYRQLLNENFRKEVI